MASNPQASDKPSGWMKLDSDVRRLILDSVYEHHIKGPYSTWWRMEKKRRLARVVRVSREWQAHFEAYTMNRFTLTESDLPRFVKIMTPSRRKGYVRHINLLIGHGDPVCWRPHDCWSYPSALHKMLDILRKWHHSSTRLTLELNLATDDKQVVLVNATTAGNGDFGYDDAIRLGRRRVEHLDRYQQPMAKYSEPLPAWTVLVVRSLVIRRQTRQVLSRPRFVGELLKRLPRLENLVYEPWLPFTPTGNLDPGAIMRNDEDYLKLLKTIQGSKLDTLTLFEEFGIGFDPSKGNRINHARFPSQAVSMNVAQISLNLRALSASYIVDAGGFFDFIAWKTEPDRSPSLKWDRLETLSLTSPLLVEGWGRARARRLLISAASAAQRMPKLRVLEIWWWDKSRVAAFQYLSEKASETGVATIHWKDSQPVGDGKTRFSPDIVAAWEDSQRVENGKTLFSPDIVAAWEDSQRVEDGKTRFSPDVVAAWEAVGDSHELDVREDTIAWIQSHGDAMRRNAPGLGLRGQVAHPASIEEISIEATNSNNVRLWGDYYKVSPSWSGVPPKIG